MKWIKHKISDDYFKLYNLEEVDQIEFYGDFGKPTITLYYNDRDSVELTEISSRYSSNDNEVQGIIDELIKISDYEDEEDKEDNEYY